LGAEYASRYRRNLPICWMAGEEACRVSHGASRREDFGCVAVVATAQSHKVAPSRNHIGISIGRPLAGCTSSYEQRAEET
jgi:hypothetical protein